MAETMAAAGPRNVTLDDKWTVDRGRVLINGTQAVARVLLAQKALDRKAGLNTAGYISGYRGSPLGGVDTTLWSISERLQESDIVFAPGVNEDIAATAVRGTQQIDAVPDPLFDGVFAAWYGKGPGVDRSGDAFKHGNFAGAHPNGGVLLFYGDDHGGKSSTVAHHSEQAVAAAHVPSLYPADVGEIIEYGLLGYALSRHTGSWVGLKLVNEVAEQTMSVDLDIDAFSPALPDRGELPPEGLHAHAGAYNPLREELVVVDYRLPLVEKFVRANGIDRTIFRSPTPRLGLVSAGKSYSDTRQALELLGLDPERASRLGVSLFKVGCIWPLEPQGIRAFAAGHETLFVVEEKQAFIEPQAALALVNLPVRPTLIGKRDEAGDALLPTAPQLEPVRIALAIAERLDRLGIGDVDLSAKVQELASLVSGGGAVPVPLPRRTPYFCSGCPHSRSTRIPDGSLSMTGIGCHTMVAFTRPAEALLPTQMGGEGGNWIGLAPFIRTRHIFQNMGDGTYYHSGLLAIRAAVAARVSITYKILYNDAVAMTGGQPVDGPISVAEIAQQVRHEGVRTIVIVSDNPDAHRGNPALPQDVRIEHRDDLDAVQREMRDVLGCSILIYEQTCAAEKRRRRKRGTFPDPAKRLFISKDVCEGCGDCSVQSTCVSLTPLETDFGTKRKIDQSSCNKDYSCLNGFCPSFVTVLGAEPRKPERVAFDLASAQDLPEPIVAPLVSGSYNMMIAGIGGTGVTTVAAVLGMAAHIDGRAASLFDMTGLAQKNGAVFSHVRIAVAPAALHSQRIGRAETDLLLAFDLVAGLADEATTTLSADRSRAVVNGDVAATVAFQFDRHATIDNRLLLTRLRRQIGQKSVEVIDATDIAMLLFGDTIAANFFIVGFTLQRGLLPISRGAIEQAIQLNGKAAAFNLSALLAGRLFADRPTDVAALLPTQPVRPDADLDAIVARRAEHLSKYQDAAYAERYRILVGRVEDAEKRVAEGSTVLTEAVARVYARFLAYKDEYEVARLLSSVELATELKANFADGARFEFNLAPPLLAGRPVNGRPPKRAFDARLMRPILSLLAKLKGIRGTVFDPFGFGAERKQERALIAEYESLVERVLESLTPENHSRAVELLGLGDMVRGYGPVKETAMRAYHEALDDTLAAFLTTPARPLESAISFRSA